MADNNDGSPMPTQEKARPRPHRCNDRVEDLLETLFTLEFSAKIRPAYKMLKECLNSEPGQEPQGGHIIVTDPQRFLEPPSTMPNFSPDDPRLKRR